MYFQRLEGSVGNGGRNNPIDVAVIQTLMKRVYSRVVPIVRRSVQILIPPDRVSGLCTPELICWIEGFQREMLNIKKPDGRIDPDGRTFKALLTHVAFLPGPLQHPPLGSTVKSLLFGPLPGNGGLLTRVDPKMFRTLYIKQSGLGLTLTNGEELLVFFGLLQKDPEITDIRWAAYMLATVHKETTFSFKASTKEDGRGGRNRYAQAVQVVDVLGVRGPKNTEYSNTYYGRGYVQLTWEENYRQIGKAYGIGDELNINPDRAHELEIAYFAATHGMRHGAYAKGHSLSRYINGDHCNYRSARQIINGFDDCDTIADWASKIELLLRLSVW
jgi:predicted chitinase